MHFAHITSPVYCSDSEPPSATIEDLREALDDDGYHRVFGKQVLTDLSRAGRSIADTYYTTPDQIVTIHPADGGEAVQVVEECGVLIVGDEVCVMLSDALAQLEAS